MDHAIVLCSGGLDSVATAFYVKKNFKPKAMTFIFFNYCQRNLPGEKKSSQYFARKLDAKWMEIKLPELGKISTSMLNSSKNWNFNIKNLKSTKEIGSKWYVPCRNTVFLTYTISFAESLFVKNKINSDIFVGFKCEGKESYPDTTEDFVHQINALSKISTESKSQVYAPLIKKDKEDIIIMANKLKIPLEKTFSCYVGPKYHCGRCLACKLRMAGFYWANAEDKTKYLA